jgi:cellulose synthase/poly-beta-1,6-N-acetylglucosamine synthase-like glycosyltransferase
MHVLPAILREHWLLILYAVVGLGAWVLYGVAMAMARTRMDRLNRQKDVTLPEPPPAVTILIPAKDEGDGIRECLCRVLALDYPDFTVIAIDDRSTDQTGAVMDALAAAHPGRFRANHIRAGGLPPGWLGKCNALHTAAAHATGEWLLFVDSDVKVEPGSLRAVLALAAGRGYDAVSIMTRLECHSFLEKLVLPLSAASVGTMTLMSFTNHDGFRDRAFANGQFFLIRRSAYETVGGHAAVRDNITEDVALMRLMKRAGFTTRLFYGKRFASTRMHTSLRQMFHGWARIYSGVCERRAGRIVAAMAFVAISGLSAYAALAYGIARAAGAGDFLWLIVAAAHWLAMTIVLAAIYSSSGNPPAYALAFPVAAPVMLGTYAYAMRACRTGKIAWRGTTYTGGSSVPSAPSAATPSAASPAEQPPAASQGGSPEAREAEPAHP